MTEREYRELYVDYFLKKYIEPKRRISIFISDIDDAGTTKYYGFVGGETNLADIAPWYILQENTITKTYRYFYGNNDYGRAWAIRATLPYDLAYNFKGWHDRYEVL